MHIDITKLSEAQLTELNQQIVARLRYLQEARMQQQMQSFRVGDRVSFHAPGHDPKTGIVAKCNRKTVTVITDDCHQWNVAPVFLSRVIVAEVEPQAARSQVIQLPGKR
ncbi:hypothetical protein [Aquabacterium sp.]|uniref:hypothetical protein n=1 Tax=Aquabacterium sp. TaxID=1872578 RepID=UPI00403821EF